MTGDEYEAMTPNGRSFMCQDQDGPHHRCKGRVLLPGWTFIACNCNCHPRVTNEEKT